MQPVAWPFTLLSANTLSGHRIATLSLDQDEAHIFCEVPSDARVSPECPRPTLQIQGHTLLMESDGFVRLVDAFHHCLDVSSLLAGNSSDRVCAVAPDSLKKEKERLPRRMIFTNSGPGGNAAASASVSLQQQLNSTVRLNSRSQLSARVTVTLLSSASTSPGALLAKRPDGSAAAAAGAASAGGGSPSAANLSGQLGTQSHFDCVWDNVAPSPIAFENTLRRINLSAFGAKKLQRGTTTLSLVSGKGWGDRRFLLANQLMSIGRELVLAGSIFSLSTSGSNSSSSSSSAAISAAANANFLLNTNTFHLPAPATAGSINASASNTMTSFTNSGSNSTRASVVQRSAGAFVPVAGGGGGGASTAAFFSGTVPASQDRFSESSFVSVGAPAMDGGGGGPGGASGAVATSAATSGLSATRTMQVLRVWFDPAYPNCVIIITRAASSALELSVSAIDRDHTYFPTGASSPVTSLAAVSSGGGGSGSGSGTASGFGSAAGSAVVQKIDVQRFFANDSMLQANDLCDPHSAAFIVGESSGVVGQTSSIRRVVLCFATRFSSSSSSSSGSPTSAGAGADTKYYSSSNDRQQRFGLIRAERNSLCSSFPAAFSTDRHLSFAFLRSSDLVAVASPVEEAVILVDSIFPRILLKCSVRQLVRTLGSGPCPTNAAAVDTMRLSCWSWSGGGSWDLRHERMVLWWNSPAQRTARHPSAFAASPSQQQSASRSKHRRMDSTGSGIGGLAAFAHSAGSIDSMSEYTAASCSPLGGGGGKEVDSITNASSVPRQQLNRPSSGSYVVLNLCADELVSSVRSLLLPTLTGRISARSVAHMLYVMPRLPRSKAMADAAAGLAGAGGGAGSGGGGGGGSGGGGGAAPSAGSVLPRVGALVEALRVGTALSRWGATAVSGWIDAEMRARWDTAPLRSITEDHPIVLLPLSQLVNMVIFAQHSAASREAQRHREQQQHQQQQQEQQHHGLSEEALHRMKREARYEHAAGRASPPSAIQPPKRGGPSFQTEAQRYAQQVMAKKGGGAAGDQKGAAARKTLKQQQPQHQSQMHHDPVTPTVAEFETAKFVIEVLDSMRIVWSKLLSPLMEEHNADVKDKGQLHVWSPVHAAELLHLIHMFSEACELSALGLDGGFGSELATDVAGEVRAFLTMLIFDHRKALRSILPGPAVARLHRLFSANGAALAQNEVAKQRQQAQQQGTRIFGLHQQQRADAARASATPEKKSVEMQRRRAAAANVEENLTAKSFVRMLARK